MDVRVRGDGAVEPFLAARDLLATEYDLAPEAVRDRLARATDAVFAARTERPRPRRDEKVLAGWNGLGISALAESALVLQEPEHADLAGDALAFVRDHLWDAESERLSRRYKDGAVGIDDVVQRRSSLLNSNRRADVRDADERVRADHRGEGERAGKEPGDDLRTAGTRFTGTTGKGEYARARSELFEELTDALVRMDPDAIILAGPGFTKQDARDHIVEAAPELADRLSTVDTSAGGDRGVHEALKRGAVEEVREETRIAEEADVTPGLIHYHFDKKQEIKKVDGVGDATYEEIKDRIAI